MNLLHRSYVRVVGRVTRGNVNAGIEGVILVAREAKRVKWVNESRSRSASQERNKETKIVRATRGDAQEKSSREESKDQGVWSRCFGLEGGECNRSITRWLLVGGLEGSA